MAGKIRTMIDTIIEQKSKGNPTIIITTKTKLLIKGIKYDNYTNLSEDDPAIIEKLMAIAKDLNINLKGGK